MKRFELHVHSSYSDGTLAPAEVVARAQSTGVELMFLTDHDTVSGFPEAEAAGKEKGVSVHCGIEINTAERDQVHILGYGFDWENRAFGERLAEFRSRRVTRVRRIVENLQRHGLPISFEDLGSVSRESLGRPHVADVLRRKRVVSSRAEAFERFLTRGRPGYVDPMGPTALEAITAIREAGGFAALAHPETVSTLEKDLPVWKENGLEALEVYYGQHSGSAVARYRDLAQRLELTATGGSDFHGPGTGREKSVGVPVPDEVFDGFVAKWRKHDAAHRA